MIKSRLKLLAEKLLSFKFAMFIITTVLRIFGIIGNGEWLTVTIVVMGSHMGMKTLHTIKEGPCEKDLGHC